MNNAGNISQKKKGMWAGGGQKKEKKEEEEAFFENRVLSEWSLASGNLVGRENKAQICSQKIRVGETAPDWTTSDSGIDPLKQKKKTQNKKKTRVASE